MNKYTLTLVFNKSLSKVLMCHHKNLGKDNYIGGKMQNSESWKDATYRELNEETGILKEDLKLYLVRHEKVEMCPTIEAYYCSSWEMYISACIIEDEYLLQEEKNKLFWIDVNDINTLLSAYNHGNCYTYLLDAISVLKDFEST